MVSSFRFTSAPILQVPTPDQQFLIEANTSDLRVGAVLFQHIAADQKLHPCPFFSDSPGREELRHWQLGPPDGESFRGVAPLSVGDQAALSGMD